MRLLDDCDIVAAHIFPFSPRPNTPAARMPQVAPEFVKSRAARLRQRAAQRRAEWLDRLVGTTANVLIESPGKGHSDSWAPVTMTGATRGDTGLARFTGRDGHGLAAVWT
jgi:threonylcarbamoyladenosine tRNA methylthiotransferase MtaB